MSRKPHLLALATLATLWSFTANVNAASISTGLASDFVGIEECEAGYDSPQCSYQGYDTSGNLAYSGGAQHQP